MRISEKQIHEKILKVPVQLAIVGYYRANESDYDLRKLRYKMYLRSASVH